MPASYIRDHSSDLYVHGEKLMPIQMVFTLYTLYIMKANLHGLTLLSCQQASKLTSENGKKQVTKTFTLK